MVHVCAFSYHDVVSEHNTEDWLRLVIYLRLSLAFDGREGRENGQRRNDTTGF